MADETEYPESWKPGWMKQDDAVALAVDSYIAALSDNELQDLLARTRGGR